MAVRLKTWHIAAIALVFLVAWYYGYLQLNITAPTPSPGTGNLVKVTKPVKFALTDPLKGSAIATATIAIYGDDRVQKESLSTGSDGTVTSGLPYASDTIVHLVISKSGYVTKWMDVTIPKMTPDDAQSLTTNFVALSTVTLGTYTIKVTDQFGNNYNTGGTLNFTALGATTVSVTFTIYNTADNTGYITSHDFLNAINLNAALVLGTAGSSVTVTGAGSSVARGTNTYWLNTLSDDGLTRQLVGTTYTKPGVTSITVTLGKGSLTAGGSQTFSINLYDYFDSGYFSSNGIGGPNSASLASFSLVVGA